MMVEFLVEMAQLLAERRKMREYLIVEATSSFAWKSQLQEATTQDLACGPASALAAVQGGRAKSRVAFGQQRYQEKLVALVAMNQESEAVAPCSEKATSFALMMQIRRCVKVKNLVPSPNLCFATVMNLSSKNHK